MINTSICISSLKIKTILSCLPESLEYWPLEYSFSIITSNPACLIIIHQFERQLLRSNEIYSSTCHSFEFNNSQVKKKSFQYSNGLMDI